MKNNIDFLYPYRASLKIKNKSDKFVIVIFIAFFLAVFLVFISTFLINYETENLKEKIKSLDNYIYNSVESKKGITLLESNAEFLKSKSKNDEIEEKQDLIKQFYKVKKADYDFIIGEFNSSMILEKIFLDKDGILMATIKCDTPSSIPIYAKALTKKNRFQKIWYSGWELKEGYHFDICFKTREAD